MNAPAPHPHPTPPAPGNRLRRHNFCSCQPADLPSTTPCRGALRPRRGGRFGFLVSAGAFWVVGHDEKVAKKKKKKNHNHGGHRASPLDFPGSNGTDRGRPPAHFLLGSFWKTLQSAGGGCGGWPGCPCLVPISQAAGTTRGSLVPSLPEPQGARLRLPGGKSLGPGAGAAGLGSGPGIVRLLHSGGRGGDVCPGRSARPALSTEDPPPPLGGAGFEGARTGERTALIPI